MRAIRLDESEWFPTGVMAVLRRHRAALEEASELDALLRFSWAAQAALQLEAIARTHYIAAYRCMRAREPARVQARGIPVLTLEGHQRAFLREGWAHFTLDEITEMRRTWADYWKPFACAAQPVKTLLCFDHAAIEGDDAQRLLRYFGSEAIVWPLLELPLILRTLTQIGTPIVLTLSLPGNDLRTHGDYALGRLALSHYHCTVNPHASRETVEGYIKRDIRADEVHEATGWDHWPPEAIQPRHIGRIRLQAL